MSQFEFFMGFYGLLLGLSVAELLLSFGNLIRAPRLPRWGIITPLVGVLIFVELIASFSDAWRKLQNVTIDFGGVTAPALIGVSFFAATLLVAPREVDDWDSLDDYYFERGRWSVAGLLMANLLTIIFLEIGSGRVSLFVPTAQVAYAILNSFVVGSLMVAFLSRTRALVISALVFSTTIVVLLYATPLDINDMTKHMLGI